MASMSARTMHTLADELGVAPELVAKLVSELKLRSKDSVRKAVADWNDQSTSTNGSTPKKEQKPKKAGLTLSQRRALLRLLDADDEGISPATAFKAMPFEYLVEIGYADRLVLDDNGDDVTNDAGIGVYTLTDEGRERAESINPGYRDWSAGETVVVDDEGNPVVVDPETGQPVRPKHGTHRSIRAQQAEAKAKADAEAKAKADAAAAKQAERDAKKAEREAAKAAKQEETTKEVVTA